MCLNPISIINPTKYVSLKYRDQYMLQVPCGKCAECQTQLSNQWLYRILTEFEDCVKSGGFAMFDALTYSNKHLPHISDYIPTKTDYPCFNSSHIQDFMKRLRIKINRAKYKVQLRYFIASEYGTSDEYSDKNGRRRRSTHRPHYHILLFVHGKVDPCKLSSFIADSWWYGRTDGIPYQSANYVLSHNTIKTYDQAAMIRTANYIGKYVQKSCEFQREINRRVQKTMEYLATLHNPDRPDEWLESFTAHRLRLEISRLCNQFHRQSLHFGESALQSMDIESIFRHGCLYMPHHQLVKIPVVLPMYYKRKLFYDLILVDGVKSWQLNDLGVEYREARKPKLLNDLANRLKCVTLDHHLNIDCHRLADYVLNWRGRIKADLPPSTLEERLGDNHLLYNYVTLTDKESLGNRGLSLTYYGNSANDYHGISNAPMSITIRDFIARYILLDEEREKELALIYYYCDKVDRGKQSAYELKQRLRNLFKSLF